jgi:hypothetical protein
MRVSNTLQKRWEGLLTVLGMVILPAIPILSVRELYWAATGRGIHTIDQSNAWITHASNPRWFVVSVVVYALVALLAIAILGTMLVGWRNERISILRNRSKPAFDDAIRLDPDSR